MRRTAWVVGLTVTTMAAEIVWGVLTGSMALLADGIHMGTHTFALVVTLVAYRVAHRHRDDPRFAFSSGKVGVLGGYTNAVLLGITALFMMKEAVERILNPESIDFRLALTVAVAGLVVNIVSALILSGGGHNHHGDDDSHDHNLRAAYIHVVTDAFTSVLAIGALLSGSLFGVTWPDAAVAMLGALVILKWSWGLLLSSGRLLVDWYPSESDAEQAHALAAAENLRLKDLHIWRTGEQGKALIARAEGGDDRAVGRLSGALRETLGLDHLTVERVGG